MTVNCCLGLMNVHVSADLVCGLWFVVCSWYSFYLEVNTLVYAIKHLLVSKDMKKKRGKKSPKDIVWAHYHHHCLPKTTLSP